MDELKHTQPGESPLGENATLAAERVKEPSAAMVPGAVDAPDTLAVLDPAASDAAGFDTNAPDDAACGSAADAEDPLQDKAPASDQEAVTVADIHFRNGGKVYFFDPGQLTLAAGDHVIIDTARGLEFGYCAAGNHPVSSREIVPPLRKVVRLATEDDEKTAAENREKEANAFRVCQEKIVAHKLDMQLVSAEYAFDGSKILFFFTADGRVDFRELVKDLASVFRTRIELRQIGVRDKAKMVGGLGICGRPFCCGEFLDDFQPVSIKMAKTQNLSLNPTKISGTCGRLMCCLKYEQEAYEDLLKTSPKQESFVDTPDGRGTVTEVNLLRQSVKVRMEDHPETIGCYRNCDICILRNGKAKKNDPPIPKENAPISSRPKPAEKKAEAAFDERLPEPRFLAKDPNKADFFQFSTQDAPADSDSALRPEKPSGTEKREGSSHRSRRRRRSGTGAGRPVQGGSQTDGAGGQSAKADSAASRSSGTQRPASKQSRQESGSSGSGRSDGQNQTSRHRSQRHRSRRRGPSGDKPQA